MVHLNSGPNPFLRSLSIFGFDFQHPKHLVPHICHRMTDVVLAHCRSIVVSCVSPPHH